MQNENDKVVVRCQKCGMQHEYPPGYLTAIREYKCVVCRQEVAELAAEEANNRGKILLID